MVLGPFRFSCGLPHHQSPELSIVPNSAPIKHWFPFILPSTGLTINFLPLWNWPLQALRMSRVLQHLPCYDQHISLSLTFWRFTHSGAGVRISFLFKAESYSCVCMDHFCLSINECTLALLPMFFIVNNASTDRSAYISHIDLASRSLGYISSRIAWSYGNSS